MTRVVLALGSNLGDRMAHLSRAVESLRQAAPAPDALAVSGVYETPPWGDDEQPAYLNAVLVVTAPEVTAAEWLERAQSLEQAAGRVRDPARRFGPRTLDVDVVAAWDDAGRPVRQDDPVLTVPHPRAHERAFVLVPWLDVDPDADLPGHGRVADLLAAEPVASDVSTVKPAGRLEDEA
ncbi:2-amino-4-hydroxy-6-hydroxymethyldihydropteridine diphosphokinase [Flindersiella endophytica]